MKIQATEAATMVQNHTAGHYQAGLAIWSGRPDPGGARAALYAKAADIYTDARPELVLYHFKWLWGVSRKVSGFVPNPDGLIRPAGMKVAP